MTIMIRKQKTSLSNFCPKYKTHINVIFFQIRRSYSLVQCLKRLVKIGRKSLLRHLLKHTAFNIYDINKLQNLAGC